MYTNFERHITRKIDPDPEELVKALAFFSYRKLNKKEFFLREGDSSIYHAFVENGAMRAYTIDEKGKEHISAFAFEGHWISDLRSFCSGAPARFNIDAMEPCDLLVISLDGSEALCLQHPKFERFFRILYQRSIGNLSYKLDDSSQLSATQRYQKLLDEHPEVIRRVPQYYIASYLGITPESLSRIRNPGT